MDEDQRWGIWIDVEGFTNLWSAGDLALRGLRHLTSMIFALGTRCFPREPSRLFAHQIGDGFYIASDFHEPSLNRCAGIAVALMRGMTGVGCLARAAIAEGDLADYSGCRPREVRAMAVRHGDTDVVSMEAGVMTLQAVMGQGLINAVTLDKLSVKGSIVSVAALARPRLSSGFITRPMEGRSDILALDWVHSSSPLIDEIASKVGFGGEDPATLRARLEAYVEAHDMASKWSEPTFRYSGL